MFETGNALDLFPFDDLFWMALGRLHAGPNAQLVIDIADVRLRRPLRKLQACGDLASGVAFRDQSNDLALSVGKWLGMGAGITCWATTAAAGQCRPAG